MYFKHHKSLTNLFLLMTTVHFTACKHDTMEPPPPVPPAIQLATSTTLGSYLTDKDNNTLYYFSNDYNGLTNCAGGCLNAWPIYNAGDDLSKITVPVGLDKADLGIVTLTDGRKQTTYKGWPLYYYAPAVNGTNVRELPGETKGEGVGNVWFVAKPDYTIMLTNAQLIGHDGKNYKSDYTEGTGKTLYFTDARGITLYGFKNDSFNINKYTKADFSNNSVWPIYETDKVVVPSTLDKTLFTSINVFGKKQLTYKGWPLYYFVQDSARRGLNKGISFPAPGVWPVITKDKAPAPKL